MKMNKLFLLLFLMTFGLSAKAQGFHGGLGMGTQYLRLELGYSISENIHIGTQLHPMIRFANMPAFYAGYFRYTFEEVDYPIGRGMYGFSYMRPYVGASLGLLKYRYVDYSSQANPPVNLSKMGFSGNIGIESSSDIDAVFASFIELNFGQIQNMFDTFESNFWSNGNNTTILTSYWGFSVGIRFYFGNY
jgi:hypothetical protein